jgi:hypothetical protein
MLFLLDPTPRICSTSPLAQYSLNGGTLTPRRGSFSFHTSRETPLEPRLSIPSTAQPGELLRLRVFSPVPLDTVAVELAGPAASALSRGIGFRSRSAGQEEWWDVLLGVPPGVPVSECALSLRAAAGERSFLLLQPLAVTERVFLSDRLHMGKDLTRLMTAPDPRKDLESRALLKILRTPHPDAQYETGTLLVPLPGARRTSSYGDRREYRFIDDTSEHSIHQGVDLAAPIGAGVPASGRGRVVFAGQRIITGNTVIMEHLPGLFSLYSHLSSISAAEGDIVEKGQVIGYVGMTGLATGPHLHWQVDALTTPVDPDALAARPLLDTETDF